MNAQAKIPGPILPPQVINSPVLELVGISNLKIRRKGLFWSYFSMP